MVVLCGFLCLTSTLYCDISLKETSCEMVFHLKISNNLLMIIIFYTLWMWMGMLVIGLILTLLNLFAHWFMLLDWIILTFYCAQRKIPLSLKYVQLRFCSRIFYGICSFPWLVPNATPPPDVGPRIFVFLKSKIPSNAICDKKFAVILLASIGSMWFEFFEEVAP